MYTTGEIPEDTFVPVAQSRSGELQIHNVTMGCTYKTGISYDVQDHGTTAPTPSGSPSTSPMEGAEKETPPGTTVAGAGEPPQPMGGVPPTRPLPGDPLPRVPPRTAPLRRHETTLPPSSPPPTRPSSPHPPPKTPDHRKTDPAPTPRAPRKPQAVYRRYAPYPSAEESRPVVLMAKYDRIGWKMTARVTEEDLEAFLKWWNARAVAADNAANN
ncbi:hypothetical protein CC1G_13509 [Coprinopsis cinerea okayama7|uniref:Uncharacterized protein n=1 Tax=Coprinopsis cinerea (strain Okayama-7 / 130 / ATCC MYA-4618 / FGSC 9003) TaxID=240176 RepID=A8PJ31_COPC7|nr:hypothetical protein CC1G_13509 [Coprinopsis cinerea okayama7\|eukprot:XP_001841658.2 hypothetical protein CC1G_13509 [Coprinopsis cinerea okayama7\